MNHQHSILARRAATGSFRGNPFRKVLLLCLIGMVFTGCSVKKPASYNPESGVVSESAREVPVDHSVDCGALVEEWLGYRLESDEIEDVQVYEEGFIAGCTGPAGLVDGAPDYNLGHSDGMLAAIGKSPPEEEGGIGLPGHPARKIIQKG